MQQQCQPSRVSGLPVHCGGGGQAARRHRLWELLRRNPPWERSGRCATGGGATRRGFEGSASRGPEGGWEAGPVSWSPACCSWGAAGTLLWWESSFGENDGTQDKVTSSQAPGYSGPTLPCV